LGFLLAFNYVRFLLSPFKVTGSPRTP